MRGVGGPIALLSALAVTLSAFVPFWNGQKPFELAMRGLWQGFGGLSEAAFIASCAMVLLVGAVILFASVAAGSQALSFLGFLWVGGFLGLFVSQARTTSSVGDFLLNDVDWGFWVAAGGALLALIAAFIPRSVKDDFAR